jgi:hypothetical protein
MPTFPRYPTFKAGELEAQMRTIGKLPDDAPVVIQTTDRSSKLLKVHTCSVCFPDGTSGLAAYERLGPAYHRFGYRYHDNAVLPHLYHLKPLENTPAAIEAKARELAATSFQEAIRKERQDRFCRVSEPTDGSRKKDPGKYQMTAKAAKEQGGKYAVCQKIGSRLLPASSLFDTIEEANDAWKRLGEDKYVVGCCNRLDRCWETPKYNPMPVEGVEEPDAAA